MVITLPVLLVLLEIIRGKTLTRRLAARMIPFVILCVIFGLIANFGKTQVLVQTSVWQKVLMAALSTSFYLWKFFIPTALSPLYAFNGVIEITVPAFSASLLVCVTLVAGLVAAFKKYPSFVAAILWYLVALSPTFINFAKGGSVFIASDRYAYIAMIGLLIAFGLLLLRCSPDFQKILLRLSTIILVVFAFMSSSQALVWADSETLFSHVLAYYPDTFSARNNLGMEYLNIARTDDAIEEFQKALAIRRDPRTLANLGAAFMQKGDFVSARKAYLEVSDIAPDLPDGFYGLGNLSLKEGKLTEAADWYNKTLVVKPGYWNALNNLAAVSIELRNYTVAIQAFSELIKIKPDFVEAHYNLAIAYEESGQYEKAAREYQTALSFTPEDSDAQLGLARVFSYEKKYTEASKILLGILTADPANEEARALAKKITAAAKR
jgi:tetratricopeptide (TPR) repeat protein